MEIVGYILSSVMVVATALIFVKIILNSKIRNNKVRVCIVSIIAIILNILVYKYAIGMYRSIFGLIIYVLTIYQFYKISLKKAIFAVVIYIILLIIPELCIIAVLNIFDLSKEYFYEVFAGSLLSNFIVYSSVIAITLILQHPLRKILNIKFNFNNNVIIFSVLTLISILVFFFDIISSVRIGTKIILYLIAIITFVSILIFLIYEESKNIKLQIKHEKLLEFMQTYEADLEKERVLKHEHKNELITIKSKIIDNDKKEKIVEYIDELLGNEEKTKQEGYTNFQYLPPNGLKALFYFKVSAAENRGITSNINIASTVKNSILKDLTTKEFKELGLLIGVFLDNAIDASEISDKKLLGIEMYETEDDVTIIISNSYAGQIDTSRIGKVHFSTKGKGRGYGLLLVNKILSKNQKFTSEREITPTLYIQTITIKK